MFSYLPKPHNHRVAELGSEPEQAGGSLLFTPKPFSLLRLLGTGLCSTTDAGPGRPPVVSL